MPHLLSIRSIGGGARSENLAQLVLSSVGINTRISMHWIRTSKKSYKLGLLLSRKREQNKITPAMLAPIKVASKVKSNNNKYRGR